MPFYVYFLIALATLVVPFALGNYLGKKLRMPEHGWKIGVCLFSAVASIVILLLGPPIKLGVDLRGGAILVYEVDRSKMEADQKVDMEKLVAALSRRVNPGGQKEVTIRPAGSDQVEIIIPEVDTAEVEHMKDIIGRAGTLEFRILANERDNKNLIERARELPTSIKTVKDALGNVLGWWVPVQKNQDHNFTDAIVRSVKRDGKPALEVLVAKDSYNVTGAFLVRADRETDNSGQPAVGFSFDSTGGQLFSHLTRDNLPDTVQNFYRRLGIILDGEAYSAPRINSEIGARGIIEGKFTDQEIKDQIDVLNAGSLPATLSPISSLISGPTLGADTIHKSSRAMMIACILVPLFMLWYYRFAGVVADIALVLNMLMLVAIMISIKAAFTLTGLAGLALTVGMAVDNNVLVFERLREERERGATLRMAIRNAFQRAGATIIDCNLTHLLAATVMYVVGTDQIRGFAVTLWLGVVISMYTAVFVAHVIFDVADKRQWIKDLKMRHLIRRTSINFMKWFPYCAAASILVTVIGLGVAVYRGAGLFDIDFTGGVSVQAQFQEPQDTGEVRKLLGDLPKDEQLPDLAISDVRLVGQEAGYQFVINTSEQSLQKVEDTITKVFGDKLARNTMTFSAPTLIVAQAAPAAATTPPAEKPAETKPADVKPADAKPAETKPADAKPAAAKPAAAKPADNAEKKSSRVDLPSDHLLAMAGSDLTPWLVSDVLAQKPEAAETKPAAPAKADAKQPAAPPAATPQPEAAAPAKAAPKSAATPAPEAANDAAPVAAMEMPPESMTNAFAGGAECTLKFTTAVDYRAVQDLLNQAVLSSKAAEETVPLSLSNPGYAEGSTKPYSEWTVKILLPPEKAELVFKAVQAKLQASPFFPASSEIGSAVAGNTRVIAIYALIASWLGIILYLWVRFQGVAFGLAAVIALVHDVLIALGAVAVSYFVAPYLPGWLMIEPFKVNLPIIAAFLTIIGYSVNDTIVVFDRIREVRGKDPNITPDMINFSINQTMSRTLLTSLTVFLVVFVLYFMGGEALHGFAFALLIGVIIGTYSSIYVAAPTLLMLIGKKKVKDQTSAK